MVGIVLAGVPHRAVAQAQAPVPRAASISGIVFDSLAQKPLVAAVVELVDADSLSAPSRTIETDSLGTYRFKDVRPGRYLIGFLHPILDSIGVERTPRAVTVDRGAFAVRMDLAVPSAHSLRVAICGAAAVADSQSLIIGIVRDAATRMAVASSTVAARWAEYTIATTGLQRRPERRTFATQETGWYGLCGARIGSTIALSASHDADSTEALELEIPATGFMRRDLFVGVARAVVGDTVRVVKDSLALETGPRRTGDGRVSGTVVAGDGGRPLAGARLGIRNGPSTRADDRGAFTLTGVPTGTRMLDVRAVAYAPQSLPVDVTEGAAPVRITLVSLKSVLDTVKVRGNLSLYRSQQEFLKRKQHSGAGRFITEEDIAKRNPVAAADLFRTMTGIMFARDDNQNDILVQRSISSFSNPYCRVAVFVNGTSLRDPTVDDLNGYLRPGQILGIEIYDGGTAPPEFSKRNGCGSVVIWTK